MIRIAILSAALAAMFVALPPGTPAQAQSIITFLSGTGAASGSCTRTAPCINMTLAFAATADHGTIVCLDSSNYGGATITRSVTIDCTGTASSVGLAINAPGIAVTVRNVRVLESNNIVFVNGASLTIENCIFTQQASGVGLNFEPNSPGAELVVTDTVFTDLGNVNGTTGGALIVNPQSGGTAVVALDRVTVANSVFGIVADGSRSTGGIAMVIKNSTIHRITQDGIVATTASGGAPIGMLVKNTLSASNNIGIRATGPSVTIRADDATVMHNGTGLVVNNGAALLSAGNNLVVANGINGAFSGAVALQ